MALTPAQKQKRYRDRGRTKRQAAGQGASPEEAAVAAIRVEDAQAAVGQAQYTAIDLWEAFEAGRAFRVFEEVANGLPTGDEEALVHWVRSEPEMGRLFYAKVAASPWPEAFDACLARWPA